MTEEMTACIDCGQPVPTIRAGNGDFSLPRCPAKQGEMQDSHRVSRSEFDAAIARAKERSS